jgi:hypothetical protein
VFDKPTLAMTIGYATFPNLAAYAFVRWLGVDVFAYLAVFFVGFGSLYAIVMQLQGEFENFKHLQDTPKPTYRNEPLRIPNLNKPTYETDTQIVKFDSEKNFFKIVLSMYEHGQEVNLTEGFWLDPVTLRSGKKYRRWQGKNEEFREMKHKYEGVVFGRRNSNRNSPYTIRDEAELRRKADGR